jgi:hypothetical protein
MKILVLVAFLIGLLLIRLDRAGAMGSYLLFAPQVVRAPLPTPTATFIASATPLPVPTGTPTPVPPPATRTPTPRPSGCHPSYPTVCIPPPPPDLDCGQISYRNFTVLRPDVHRFDGDGDGVGCET